MKSPQQQAVYIFQGTNSRIWQFPGLVVNYGISNTIVLEIP